MKIIVSASGPDLDSQVDSRFGRAPYFLAVDLDTMTYEALVNQQNLQASQGAGVQAAALVARHQPIAVLTGHCGPKAFQTLKAASIPVIVGVEGTVREAVERYKAGQLQPAKGPDVHTHW